MEARISIITLGVKDLEKSFEFYTQGLGFPTSRKPEQNIVFYQTSGTTFALYPLSELAKDVGEKFCNIQPSKFSGITLAHNTKEKNEVDLIIQKAIAAGATLEKKPQDTFWGGYSGYFSDPDGYLWEIAWGAFPFNEDGSLKVD